MQNDFLVLGVNFTSEAKVGSIKQQKGEQKTKKKKRKKGKY